MNWIPLTSIQGFEQILEKSSSKPQVIFKHSTRCSTSSVALRRFERADDHDQIDFYYLDLIAYREVSNKIAEELSVYHESPQVILIKNKECIYSESHLSINMEELIEESQVA
jgi:bacillithiol system protein YtxJ